MELEKQFIISCINNNLYYAHQVISNFKHTRKCLNGIYPTESDCGNIERIQSNRIKYLFELKHKNEKLIELCKN